MAQKQVLSAVSGSNFYNFNDGEDDADALLYPPDNFAQVAIGIYRSAYPGKRSFRFLRQLRLRAVLFLCPEEYSDTNRAFLNSIGARFLQFGVDGNKEPCTEIPRDVMAAALRAVVNPANQPLLIHCNKGKHRTGCLVGCLRKLMGWSMTAIFDEYHRFAQPKSRLIDLQFIELFFMNDNENDDIAIHADSGDSVSPGLARSASDLRKLHTVNIMPTIDSDVNRSHLVQYARFKNSERGFNIEDTVREENELLSQTPRLPRLIQPMWRSVSIV